MINQTCSQNYTRNQNNAGWQMNAIPVRTIGGIFTIYFPRPWLITGLVSLSPSAGANPAYVNSLVTPLSPAQQAASANMPLNIFLDLAFATTHEFSNGYLINYVEPGIQGKDYRGKFSRWLNNQALNTPEQMYNSIIQPESIVSVFHTRNAAVAADVWTQRYYEMINTLKLTIDQELMGAPGIYTIGDNGTASPLIDAQTDYELFIPE